MTTKSEPLRVRAVISGGQSGVMRAALDVAINLGLAHGGIAPRNRIMDDGVLAPRYALVASNDRNHYQLALHNIHASDGTLIITRAPEMDHMSEYVMGRARRTGKPTYHLPVGGAFDRALAWMCEYRIAILNVHGPREVGVQRIPSAPQGNRNHQPGIAADARAILLAALRPHAETIRANALAHADRMRAESQQTSSDVVPAQTAPARPRDPEPHGPPLAPRP